MSSPGRTRWAAWLCILLSSGGCPAQNDFVGAVVDAGGAGGTIPEPSGPGCVPEEALLRLGFRAGWLQVGAMCEIPSTWLPHGMDPFNSRNLENFTVEEAFSGYLLYTYGPLFYIPPPYTDDCSELPPNAWLRTAAGGLVLCSALCQSAVGAIEDVVGHGCGTPAPDPVLRALLTGGGPAKEP